MGRYQVFDLETENYEARKRFASPFDERNYVVARGWKNQGDAQNSWEHFKSPEEARRGYLRIPQDVTLLVGFNIKFDLLWEMHAENPDLRAFFKRGGKIWCCQYAEYLLQGQHPDFHMVSLDDVAEKYGGRKKLGGPKEMWEQGYKTSQIHPDMLIDYLVGTPAEGRNSGDIGNTEKVFLGQIKIATEKKMLEGIMLRMDGLCATTEMEWNGLHIDIAEAKRRAAILEQELAKTETELESFIPALPEGLEFSWASRVHVSALVFGGTIKYQRRLPYLGPDGKPVRKKAFETVADGMYLSGKRKGEIRYRKVEVEGELKVKWQDFFHTLPGYTHPLREWTTDSTDGAGQPIYSTGADVIEALEKRDMPFCKALGKRAALVKELGTYYVRWDPKKKAAVGMLTCVNPADHMIHHKLNHTSTVTTRLSSSDPNLQNVPTKGKSEVKKMFTSRFGDEGAMMEIDYSQLEVVIQGMLSGDANLCADLRNRVDFHCKRVSAKYGISYEDALDRCKNQDHPDYAEWSVKRRGVKEFSFQRAYGAGAAAISEATGLDIDTVKDLIEAEEKMYPGVARFNEMVEKTVQKNQIGFRDAQRGFRLFHRGYYQAPTGCLYSFRTWDAPDFLRKKGIADSYSPPELKNYPIQGTGGEVVQIVLGKLWRLFVATDNFGGNALLCNTVHDCVWFDYKKEIEKELIAAVVPVMEAVPQYMSQHFGMKVDVPFPVDVEVGPNMHNLKHPE